MVGLAGLQLHFVDALAVLGGQLALQPGLGEGGAGVYFACSA